MRTLITLIIYNDEQQDHRYEVHILKPVIS